MRSPVATLLLLAMTLAASQGQQMRLKTVMGMISTKAADCIVDKKRQMPDLITVIAQVSAGSINNTKARCFPTCVLEKLGIMTVDNHTFSADSFKSNVDTIEHPKMKELLMEQLPTCTANATSEDSCEKGLQFVDCYVKAGILRHVETSDRLTLASQNVPPTKRRESESSGTRNVDKLSFPPKLSSIAAPVDVAQEPNRRSRRQTEGVMNIVPEQNLSRRRENSRHLVIGLDSATYTLDVPPPPTNTSKTNASTPIVTSQTVVPNTRAQDSVLPSATKTRTQALEDFSNTSSPGLPDIQYKTDTLHVHNMSSYLPSLHNMNKRPRVPSILTKSSLPKKPKAKAASDSTLSV